MMRCIAQTVMTSIRLVIAIVFSSALQMTSVSTFGNARVLSDSDRAVIFAVQQEIQSSHFEKRNDVCEIWSHINVSRKKDRLRIEKAKYKRALKRLVQ